MISFVINLGKFSKNNFFYRCINSIYLFSDNRNPSRETVNRGSLDLIGIIGELIVKKDGINNKLTKIKQFPKNELKFQIQLKRSMSKCMREGQKISFSILLKPL